MGRRAYAKRLNPPAATPPRAGASLRRCLGYGPEHEFWSDGPHHRVCPGCRQRQSDGPYIPERHDAGDRREAHSPDY